MARRRRKPVSLLEAVLAESAEQLTDVAAEAVGAYLRGLLHGPPAPPPPPAPPRARAGDAYARLGLAPSVARTVAEGAWRAIVKQHHPDAGGDPERFRVFLAAWETIKTERGWR